MRQGAKYAGKSLCDFTVWAPFALSVDLKIDAPQRQPVGLKNSEGGYWHVRAEECPPGTRYRYVLDNGRALPDPASHFQPEGVHGPSAVVDHNAFRWTDSGWKGVPLASMVLYELHVGAFTPEGTFEAIIPRLEDLKDLGINAIELMPVAQFPGDRNWGYDGVYPYAVQNSYGGPDGLKQLVNACHQLELAVVLDVVYNHLGPEGNYLGDFGPYFTDRYRTPWGEAINFDGPHSDEVRAYFIGNALQWITEYHIDALRVDAVHGIFDFSAKHFLQDLGEAVHFQAQALRRNVYVIPESDLNDVRLISPVEIGGYNLDAQWNDDFHHALHALLTGERRGYYEDFGKLEHMVKALREGFVYSGGYSVCRKRRHGNDSRDRPAHQFVVFSQNHDQVGNRMNGDRLPKLVSFEALKLAAAAVVLSPGIPLLFMGEEYGEENPFLYFVSHSDPDLIDAVRRGRKEEFRAFSWEGEPPDPQSGATFRKSKLRRELSVDGKHKALLAFYKRLLRLRKEIPALAELDRSRLIVSANAKAGVIAMRRWSSLGTSHVYLLFNFDKSDKRVPFSGKEGRWGLLLDSSDAAWAGPGSPLPHVARPGGLLVLRGESASLYIQAGEEP
jgi:maltooligosyltrehalose trehalohydrolase